MSFFSWFGPSRRDSQGGGGSEVTLSSASKMKPTVLMESNESKKEIPFRGAGEPDDIDDGDGVGDPRLLQFTNQPIEPFRHHL